MPIMTHGSNMPDDPLRRTIRDRREVARLGEDPPGLDEVEVGQQGEQVVGGCVDEQAGTDDGLVGGRPASSGGEDATGQADGQKEDGATDSHREGGREAFPEIVEHRDAVLEGHAEAGPVAVDRDGAGLDVPVLHEAAHVLDVLLGSGPVETEVVTDAVEPGGGAAGLGAVGQGGVVGTVEEDREDHHRHGDEDEHPGDEATHDVAEHWLLLSDSMAKSLSRDRAASLRSGGPPPAERPSEPTRCRWVGPDGLLFI